MKKNKNRQPRTRLQSIDNAQLAQVAGGASLLHLRDQFSEGTGWYEFFDAAYYASGGCQTAGTCNTPIP